MTWTLVTGASGFVGSYLMQELQKQGIQVKGVSRTNKIGFYKCQRMAPRWIGRRCWVMSIQSFIWQRAFTDKDRARDPSL